MIPFSLSEFSWIKLLEWNFQWPDNNKRTDSEPQLRKKRAIKTNNRMSQKVDQPTPGSEDIFSTEELLLGQDEFPGDTETAAEELQSGESMDSKDKIDRVLEDQELEAMDEIIDTEETNEDDLEVESSEMTEGQGKILQHWWRGTFINSETLFADTEVDGTSSKPAKKLNNPDKLTELPLAKVKHIIKLDPEVNLVNGECGFANALSQIVAYSMNTY